MHCVAFCTNKECDMHLRLGLVSSPLPRPRCRFCGEEMCVKTERMTVVRDSQFIKTVRVFFNLDPETGAYCGQVVIRDEALFGRHGEVWFHSPIIRSARGAARCGQQILCRANVYGERTYSHFSPPKEICFDLSKSEDDFYRNLNQLNKLAESPYFREDVR